MSEATKRTVPVTIQGREYRIKADGDAELIRQAASLLDETIEKVRARAGTVDSLDIAVLAALNLANHLVQARSSGPVGSDLGARVAALIELVDGAVGDPLSLAN